jgi:putative membrane protein
MDKGNVQSVPADQLPGEVKLLTSDVPQEDPRVFLAAERTLLAWIRTGLAMMGFGFIVARSGIFFRQMLVAEFDGSPPKSTLSLWIGCAMILLGALLNLLAGAEHVRFIRQLPTLRTVGRLRLIMGLASAITMGILGLLMVGYLATL